MKNLKIELHEKEILVDKEDYIKAKTKDLIEFGYASLSEDDVRIQIEKILNEEELSVIGLFMEEEIKGEE
jgi:hypothetical protein